MYQLKYYRLIHCLYIKHQKYVRCYTCFYILWLFIFLKKSEYATFQVVCGLAERECIDPPTTKLN